MDINEWIDLESAKERFMENETLFKGFLFELPERDLYPQLLQNLRDNNVSEAFETAHRLKGVVGNLSLNRLSREIEPVVEVLRKGAFPEKELLDRLDSAYLATMEQIRAVKEENIHLF